MKSCALRRLMFFLVCVHVAVSVFILSLLSVDRGDQTYPSPAVVGWGTAAMVWIWFQSDSIAWCLVLINVAGLGVSQIGRTRARVLAQAACGVLSTLVLLAHVGMLMAAAKRGLVSTPTATYVMDDPGYVTFNAIWDAVLCLPAAALAIDAIWHRRSDDLAPSSLTVVGSTF